MSLVFDNVSFTYSSHEGQVAAVSELSFTVEDGEFLGIIGHTGSGKSTLLQLMCGLLQPSLGHITFNGQDLAAKQVRRTVFKDLGIAFQYPEQQLFAKTVALDIGFAPKNAGLSPAEIDAAVRGAMAALHLDYERYAHKSPFDLSGGEMRRVALAAVMASSPKFLILDEPTAGLDPKTQKELADIVCDYHQMGNTLVLVSHNMDNIARLCTKVLVLKDGRQVAYERPEVVFAHAQELRDINLGVPKATTFAAELQEKGLPISDGLLTVEQLANNLAAMLGKVPARSQKTPDHNQKAGRSGL